MFQKSSEILVSPPPPSAGNLENVLSHEKSETEPRVHIFSWVGGRAQDPIEGQAKGNTMLLEWSQSREHGAQQTEGTPPPSKKDKKCGETSFFQCHKARWIKVLKGLGATAMNTYLGESLIELNGT